MQMVKIQIPDRTASVQAMLAMSRRYRVDCYADDVYIVPEAALEILKDQTVRYHELGRGGLDSAAKTLRDTLAAHAQRRASGQPGTVRADT